MILSPCFGTVIFLKRFDSRSIMRIFISPFSRHDILSPVAGKIIEIKKRNGSRYPAFFPIAARKNKSIDFSIDGDPYDIRVIVFAGLTTYRLNPSVNVGNDIVAKEPIALIKFGSMVEINGDFIIDDHLVLFSRIAAGDIIGTRQS